MIRCLGCLLAKEMATQPGPCGGNRIRRNTLMSVLGGRWMRECSSTTRFIPSGKTANVASPGNAAEGGQDAIEARLARAIADGLAQGEIVAHQLVPGHTDPLANLRVGEVQDCEVLNADPSYPPADLKRRQLGRLVVAEELGPRGTLRALPVGP